MAVDFKIIVITGDRFVADEGEMIGRLLLSGAADCVHLRKPGADNNAMRKLIQSIPRELHNRLKLHGNFELLNEFNLGGVHLPDRDDIEKPSSAGKISRSLHSIDNIKKISHNYEYVTLSPVFDSISKHGYKAAFDTIRPGMIESNNVIALGGVTPRNFQDLKNAGFAGAALLGYIFDAEDKYGAMRQIKIHRPGYFNLQFITNGETVEQTVSQATKAIENGCRWVQVRMKNATDTDVEEALNSILPIAKAHKAILLVDDRVEIAKRCRIDGVHLGKDDMSVDAAREILGEQAIIGATANTFDDMMKSCRADYFGVGPFRYTTTKKRLAPVLGIEGYRRIISKKNNSIFAHKPIVAIGGITTDDVAEILATGVNGIAASGAIINATDMKSAIRKFKNN